MVSCPRILYLACLVFCIVTAQKTPWVTFFEQETSQTCSLWTESCSWVSIWCLGSFRGHLGHSSLHKGWTCILLVSSVRALSPAMGTQLATSHRAGQHGVSESPGWKCLWDRARGDTQHWRRGRPGQSTSQPRQKACRAQPLPAGCSRRQLFSRVCMKSRAH